MATPILTIDARDNVAIALRDLKSDETVQLPDGHTLITLTDVPYSHKVALKNIAAGEDIIKYGEIIGTAIQAIRRGQWVHTHNLTIEEKG